MKLYLDENLSPKFRRLLTHDLIEIYTFQFMTWQGKKNGELLRLLSEYQFRGIITSDKLMYSDQQLKNGQLHFFLIQSALDTPAARNPLFDLLNEFLTESYSELNKARASKIVVADGLVDRTMTRGVHVLWVE